LAKQAYNEQANITDAISKAVSDLVQSAKPKGGAIAMREFIAELYSEISDRAENPKLVHGLETGLGDFDKITHGMQKGEEFILAGQPGTGKSLLAFQLGCGMAVNGHPGAVYALEMSGKAMVRRRLSAITKIPTYNMQSGVDMNSKWEKLNEGVEELDALPIYISDATDWTTLQLRADLSRLKQQQGVEWFILDYLDLLVDNYGKDRNEKSEYLSRQIHGICKDLDLAGLVIQSLNKGGYGSSPKMSHLSGSHKVSYDADAIAILTEDENEENVVNLIWDKMREADGKRALKLVKVPGFPAFGEYTSNNNGYKDWSK
jgi:replicative DNA helicase